MNKRVGERSLVRVGRGEQAKSYICTSARWRDCDGMGKGGKKNVRVWFAAVYPDICLRYCHTDLSISLLISISAEVKMEADLQWNKRTKITPARDAAALSL